MNKVKHSKILIVFAQTVFCLFCATAPYAQFKNTKIFLRQDSELSPCSEKYILDSLGEFFVIRGCENKKTVYLGVYQLEKDIVSFRFKSITYFQPLLRTEESAPENDSLVKITLLSCLGNPVPASFEIDAIETNGKFYKSFTVNENGEILLNPYKYKTIRLTTLNHYYAGWQYIEVKPKNQKIYLHLPEEFFASSHPFIWFLDDFSLLLKPDGLYDMQAKTNLYPAIK